MIHRIFFLFGAFLMASACAPTQEPKFRFPTETRIGIINHLEHYATHQNFSSLRIGSFSKKIDVDWNLPAYFENRLIRILQDDPRYIIIPIKPAVSSDKIEQHSAIIDQISMTDEIKPQVADFLETIADEHDLDVIIIIKSYRGPSVFKLDKHPIELKGYGLFTKVFLISKNAYAYAHTAVVVFNTNPLTYIGSGKPQNKKSPLSNFDLSGDLENIPQSEINKLQPIIQKYADQAVTNGLNDANLISGE
jgi:hypothetical protein